MKIVNCCLNRNRLTDLEKEIMVPRVGGEDGGRDSKKVWEGHIVILLYLKWITDKDLLHSTCNSAQCYVATWMGGEFGGKMDICMCMAKSLHCSPEIITALPISYTPIQNKKFFKK